MTAGVGTKSTILIADDDPGIRSLLTVMCTDMGFETIEAADGTEAVARMQKERPDLALVDAIMPELNGFEVVRCMKQDEALEHIPVIMLTGLRSREDRLKGIRAGANDFLTKPIDAEELLLRVKNHLKIKAFHDFLASHNEILERQVAERTQELEHALSLVNESHIETIYRLAAASEYKDPDTGEHIKRISYFARELAEAVGLDSGKQETIFHAASMHDIGKTGIPDRILLKEGPLTGDEWARMKTHTTIGAAILSGSRSNYLSMAETIALNHHEKWCGGGYPRDVRGEAIPLPARIVALADQYDALRSRRPYKKPIDAAAAETILLRGDGRTQPDYFDPEVLAAFDRRRKSFREIYEEINP